MGQPKPGWGQRLIIVVLRTQSEGSAVQRSFKLPYGFSSREGEYKAKWIHDVAVTF